MGSSFFRGLCFFAANSQMDQERQGSPQQDDAAHQGQLTKIPHNHGAKNLAAQFEFQRHGHGFAKFQPGMRVMPYLVVNCLDAGH